MQEHTCIIMQIARTPYSLHAHTHTHTHTHHTREHTQAPLAVTSIGFSFSDCFHEVYMCMNVHTHCYVRSLCTLFITHTAHTHTVHLHCYRNGILCTTHTYTHVQYTCTHGYKCKTLSMSTHTHTHTCTLHVRSILNLFSAPAHALYSI